MSVILKDISVEKRKNNNYSDNTTELRELSYYHDMAKKCISLFSGPQMRPRMLNDEDAISHVSENIIWGHMRWKEEKGRTLKSYLNQCGIWAIKSWKTKIYESTSSKKEVSLNQDFNDSSAQHYTFIADKKCSEPFEILYDNKSKNIQKIVNSNVLTELQKTCLQKRYVESKKLREIAEELKITKQAVNQHIKSAIRKLRKCNGVC
mgnify:CR=1 FL=1